MDRHTVTEQKGKQRGQTKRVTEQNKTKWPKHSDKTKWPKHSDQNRAKYKHLKQRRKQIIARNRTDNGVRQPAEITRLGQHPTSTTTKARINQQKTLQKGTTCQQNKRALRQSNKMQSTNATCQTTPTKGVYGRHAQRRKTSSKHKMSNRQNEPDISDVKQDKSPHRLTEKSYRTQGHASKTAQGKHQHSKGSLS